MNQAGPGETHDANARAQAVLKHHNRMLQSIQDEIVTGEELLRQTIKKRNALLSLLFPPVRVDRDPRQIKARIEELGVESMQLKQAIMSQEIELQSLDLGLTSSMSIGDGDLQQRLIQGGQNLTDLKSKLADCHINLDKMRSMLSPIRTLPVEILGDIFSNCKESLFTSSTPPPTLLSLTHVCSLWRSVAVNKSDLWTSVFISIDDGRDKRDWPSLIELWIKRSRDFPLSFFLRQSDSEGYTPSASSDFFRLLDLYMSQSQRWKNADIANPRFDIPGFEMFDQLSSNTSFPILESMSMKCRTMENSDLTKLMDMLDRSPRLHSVTWKIKSQPFILSFPWAQLTHLNLLVLLDIEETLDILSTGDKLVSAELLLQIDPNGVRNFHEPIIRRNLQTLSLGASGDLEILLDFLTMPNLTSLTLDELPSMTTEDGMNVPWRQAALLSFLQRSQCKLQELSLIDVQLNTGDVLSLLRHTSPTLIRFEIHPIFGNRCITDDVLIALTYPTSSNAGPENLDEDLDSAGPAAILCPHLRHIKFYGSLNTTDGLLSEMLKSRLSPATHSPKLQRLLSGEFGMKTQDVRPHDHEGLLSISRNFPFIQYDMSLS